MIWYKEEVVSSYKYAYAKYFKDVILKCKSSMIKQIKCYNCQDVMAAEMWGNFSNDLFHVILGKMSYQDVTYFKRKKFKSGQYFWESSQPSPINPKMFNCIKIVFLQFMNDLYFSLFVLNLYSEFFLISHSPKTKFKRTK